MTNEEEQITLNIDLYDNIMTEKEGDYTGRPRITGTRRTFGSGRCFA